MTDEQINHLLQNDMMWLLSAWTNFLVTASSMICFTWNKYTQHSAWIAIKKWFVKLLIIPDASIIYFIYDFLKQGYAH